MASRPLILVVEDDFGLREGYTRLLGALGCDVVCAANPNEAFFLLERWPRPFLILSDLEMPEMNGDEFCRLFREQDPTTPFILVSGHPDVFRIATACGATRAFWKPIDSDALRKLIFQGS